MSNSPQLEFLGQGALYASQFDDVYFKENGIEESRHVFIDGVDFEKVKLVMETSKGQEKYRIGETGFGTGLNFVLALDAWRQLKIPGILEFYSVEKYPLSSDQMKNIADERKVLSVINFEWVNSYCQEVDRLSSEKTAIEVFGRDFHLHVECGEGGDILNNWCQSSNIQNESMLKSFDAWFLDGFDPIKNKDLWNYQLFESIRALSKPGAKMATYTSSGIVKRPLIKNGFVIQKREGVLGKQHVIHGSYDANKIIAKLAWQDYLDKALVGSLQKGAIDESMQLIEEGANINKIESYFAAANKGVLHKIVTDWLDLDLLMDGQLGLDDRGDSILHASIRSRKTQEVTFLVNYLKKANIDPNQFRDKHGRTALFLCAHQRDWGLCELLLDLGFDPFIKDRYNKSISELQRNESHWFELLANKK